MIRRNVDTRVPDTRGLNFYDIDGSLHQVLPRYMPGDLLAHLEPHMRRLGGLVGDHLDDLAHAADFNPPTLRHRDRTGAAWQWIDKHPAYREMERLAFGELGLARMSHQEGVLGWPARMPPAAKYALTYLFVQSEFGLCCPVNMTDSLTRNLIKFASDEMKEKYLPILLSNDLDRLGQGAMFLTEQGAGSDVGAVECVARHEDGQWRIYGEKWFCSNADAELVLVLARPEGAPGGTRGLGLFLLPRHLDDGRQNSYRIVRLKDKLGTRAMPSGEVTLEGAVAYPIGELDQGWRQMADGINNSRLSNGIRAAGLMRRSWHEALHVARERVAFGRRLLDMPLMRRQLMKILLPTEQALSFAFYTAEVLGRADADGTDEEAKALGRILTPLIKFRACRDARKVAGDSMEVRGGSGYIEEWINPRLLRDSHLGSIWEGTSNVVAQDVLRSSRKLHAHTRLAAALEARLDAAGDGVPDAYRDAVMQSLGRATALVDRALDGNGEPRLTRQASSAMYNVACAVLMAWEGVMTARETGDARRLVLSRAVYDHRLDVADPLAEGDADREGQMAEWLLEDPAPGLDEAARFVAQGL
ncbi:MAG: acyl-CoA dehydrogenase family protein [Hyphomicrobiales bacterium]|nr:acyl-CoA dehydrogenase family protein [Hyphomicrobiales bacterium]